MSVDPWISKALETIATERRAMRLDAFNADTAMVHQGRKIERERMAAYEGYQRYEPENGAPNAD